MIEKSLAAQLETIAGDHRRFRLFAKLALGWAVGVALAVIYLFFCLPNGIVVPQAGSWLLTAGAMWGAGVWIWSEGLKFDLKDVARNVEKEDPKLNSLLLAAIEQKADAATGKLGYLQERVITEALERNRQSVWGQKMADRLVWARGLHKSGLIVFSIGVLALFVVSPKTASRFALAPVQIEISPGDTNVEKGSSLAVLAKFNQRAPTQVKLVTTVSGKEPKSTQLEKSLADPIFGLSLPEVREETVYHLEYDGKKTRDYRVTVFEYPALEHADAHLDYPAYTGIPAKTIQDTRRVSAVEGTKLNYSFHLNKPVASAKLVGKGVESIPLAAAEKNGNVYTLEMNLAGKARYELQLVDAEGRTNRIAPEFALDGLPNLPPELKFISPRGDQRVSALEEMLFNAEGTDDFGMGKYGLAYSVAGAETQFVELGHDAAAHEKRSFQYLLSLENFKAEPDQLVSYYLWAEDAGPDGQTRRSFSDMYFAEVRRFEEIFRQGAENPPSDESSSQQGQQGQGDQSAKLAELQKQIINATWKLQRQETAKKPSAKFKQDAGVLDESQQSALEKVGALKEKAEDPQMLKIIAQVEKEMEKAEGELKTAAADNTVSPLPTALAAEQAAYQSLLKLAAREFQVTKGQNKGSGASGQAGRQQQLDQLDMKEADKRYEKQSEAAAQKQTAEQKEELQVLNRLKELARRQEDVSGRLKELQTALQEAKTEEEKEEVRRQLKRLREEQQEIVQDMDELKQRMSQPENQSRMAQAKDQLDKTREQANQAAKDLDKESVSQALSSTTRTERDLKKLSEDFRKSTSSRFTEEMRQMRNEAQNLAQKEQEAAKKLDELAKGKQKTLSDSGERQAVLDQLAKQKANFTNLVENIRKTSEQAETAEPLLSKQLYDTVRKLDQQSAEKMLDLSNELLKRNLLSQAGEAESRARKSIDELKSGVEKAAQSVLGDEDEALRNAKRELEDLSQKVEKELAKATGGQSGKPGQRQGKGEDQKGGEEPGLLPGDGGPGPKQEPGLAQNETGQGEAQESDSKEPGKSPGPGKGQGKGRQPGDKNQQAQKGKGSGKGEQGEGQEPGEGEGQADGKQPDDKAQQAQNGQGQGKGEQGQGRGQAEGQQEGRQPGDKAQQAQSGKGSGQGGQPGQGQGQGEGQQDGKQPEDKAQQAQNGRGGKAGQGRGQGGGQPSDQAQANQPDQPRPGSNPAQRGNQRNQANNRGNAKGGNFFDQSGAEGGGGDGNVDEEQAFPLTGKGFSAWSDRLRDVEEMIDDPALRTEVARIGAKARGMRAEFKNKGKNPEWNKVKADIVAPLAQVRAQIAEELARRASKEALVPVDRDPVPQKFSELVDKYYEKLGKSE